MKKQTKIFLTILIVLIASISIFALWQKDNISALISGLNNSSEDLAAKMDENRVNLKAEVEKYVSKPITDITAEDEQKLLKGEVTVEDIADKYNLPLDYMKDSDTENNEASANPVKEPNDLPVSNETIQTDTKAIDKAISVCG